MDNCIGNQFDLDHSTLFMGIVSELRTFRSVSHKNEKVILHEPQKKLPSKIIWEKFSLFSYELHNTLKFLQFQLSEKTLTVRHLIEFHSGLSYMNLVFYSTKRYYILDLIFYTVLEVFVTID